MRYLVRASWIVLWPILKDFLLGAGFAVLFAVGCVGGVWALICGLMSWMGKTAAQLTVLFVVGGGVLIWGIGIPLWKGGKRAVAQIKSLARHLQREDEEEK